MDVAHGAGALTRLDERVRLVLLLTEAYAADALLLVRQVLHSSLLL